MGYEITSGKIATAKKVVIYGTEGIGKTTFASRFPDPLFIDTEGSTVELDVKRLPAPSSWSMLIDEVGYVIKTPGICKTLVIDTADWAERLAINQILAAHNKHGIEDFGYGNGYRYAYEEFGRILNGLQMACDKGINIVLTAHATLRKFEQPDEMGAYDRWALKLIDSPKCSIAAAVKEWADIVLFANYRTYVVSTDESGRKHKAQGGKRVMYTQHHPCWDAKNRHGLAEELPFDYAEIAHLFTATVTVTATASAAPVTAVPTPTEESPVINEVPPVTEEPVTRQNQSGRINPVFIAIKELMDADGIKPEEVRQAVADKGYYPFETLITQYDVKFVEGYLIAAWDKVKDLILKNRKGE